MNDDYVKLYFLALKRIIELEKENYHLKTIAYVDPLTKLKNRRSIEEREFKLSSNISIALGDVDHFKTINDEYGHSVGDNILKEIGLIINQNIRREDFAIRYGGDEILIILQDCLIDSATDKINELKKIIHDEIYIMCGLNVTMCFGLAISGDNKRNIQELIEEADQALYESKQRGRDCVTINKKYVKKR